MELMETVAMAPRAPMACLFIIYSNINLGYIVSKLEIAFARLAVMGFRARGYCAVSRMIAD
jgi:hypothetical protein